jgi:hypothetical protein
MHECCRHASGQAMLVVWLRLALTTVGNFATEVRYASLTAGWHTALSVMQLVIARKDA